MPHARKKEKLELRELTKGSWVLDQDIVFTDRKKALMGRDPLVKDLLDKLASYNPRKDKPSKKEIDELKQDIEKKCNIGVVITGAAQPHIYGLDIIKKSNFPLAPVKIRFPDKEETMEPLLIFNRTRGYPVYAFPELPVKYLSPVDPSEDCINIQIDLRLINKKSGPMIKDAIWEIVANHLQKKKDDTRFPLEPQELKIVYTSKQNTFNNYLRWYDLAIGTDYQKPNGYSFRAIELLNQIWIKHPELYEDAKREIANRTKIIRSTRGEKVLKGVVGEPVKGEDKVEKAVKQIYGAIHRKPYPSKKAKQKKYNCPTHGKLCPMECLYLKNWMKDFNKATMLFKPLHTTDPTVLPQIVGEGRSHSKGKPTADQQSNIK